MEFEKTESDNFSNHSELLLQKMKTATLYIGSVKREYSCLRRDWLKQLRCI